MAAYIIDFSDTAELGNSLYINSTGLHFTTSAYSLVIDIDIANFTQ